MNNRPISPREMMAMADSEAWLPEGTHASAFTTTPGAASELQMQKYLNGSDDDLVDVCMQVYARSCMYNTQVLHDAAMAYCAELKRRLRERAPPAPVTEGAQREAVADDKPYVTFTREGIHVDIARYLKSPKGQAALKRIASTEPLYCENCGATDGNGCGACPAPPPPDRVQPVAGEERT